MNRLTLLAPIALLAACGGGDSPSGGVTRDENRALDEAAEMIEARRIPAEALRATGQPVASPSVIPATTAPAP